MSSDLLDAATALVERAHQLGVDEVSATASRGTQTTLARRAGRVEQATQSTTRGVVVALMVDGRYSSHSTSDLRTDALEAFLVKAIAATRYMEEDPDRRLPPAELCGRGATASELDQDDPAWYELTAADRAEDALALERAVDALAEDDVVSTTVHLADGHSQGARVMSNGFADLNQGAWFALGAEMTLIDGERRPEAAAWYSARYRSDLPTPEEVAAETTRRARERIGSGPIPSGTYPMLLANRAAGRLLGVLGAPLAGSNLHERRSCLADRLGQPIGSELLTIVDDPTIPRGLGSRPWDGDGLVAKPRVVVERGVLRTWFLNMYYSRKLEQEPTSGSRSNWVLPPGDRSWQAIARELPRAILVTGFLGGNSNSTTGDFSFGIRGLRLEHGEVVQSLSEMNVTGNLLEVFHDLVEAADDPWMWSSVRCPTLVFDEVQFSGT